MRYAIFLTAVLAFTVAIAADEPLKPFATATGLFARDHRVSAHLDRSAASDVGIEKRGGYPSKCLGSCAGGGGSRSRTSNRQTQTSASHHQSSSSAPRIPLRVPRGRLTRAQAVEISLARQANARAGRHDPYPLTPPHTSPRPGYRTPHSGTSIDSGKSSRRPSTSSSDSGDNRWSTNTLYRSPSPHHPIPSTHQATTSRQHANAPASPSRTDGGPRQAQRHLSSFPMHSRPLKIESPPRPGSSSSSAGHSPPRHHTVDNRRKGKEKAPPSPPRRSSSSSSSVSSPKTPQRFSGAGPSSVRHH